jgi:hypothetical protein
MDEVVLFHEHSVHVAPCDEDRRDHKTTAAGFRASLSTVAYVEEEVAGYRAEGQRVAQGEFDRPREQDRLMGLHRRLSTGPLQSTTFKFEEKRDLIGVQDADVQVSFEFDAPTGEYTLGFQIPGLVGEGSIPRTDETPNDCEPKNHGVKSSPAARYSQSFDEGPSVRPGRRRAGWTAAKVTSRSRSDRTCPLRV